MCLQLTKSVQPCITVGVSIRVRFFGVSIRLTLDFFYINIFYISFNIIDCTKNGSWDIGSLPVWWGALPVWWNRPQLRLRTLNQVIWYHPRICTTNGSWNIGSLPVWWGALPVWRNRPQLRLRTLNQVIWYHPRICTTNGSCNIGSLPVWWVELPVWRNRP